jgi:hypothetical protein
MLFKIFKKENLTCLAWFLLASQIGEFFLPLSVREKGTATMNKVSHRREDYTKKKGQIWTVQQDSANIVLRWIL